MVLQPIELISFNLCPFVQRSVITLLRKGLDFKITYIDLADKPDWFLKISPLGKVPVVRYGDETLFESAVINEFIDEITPPSLMPATPLEKAKDRAWIEYTSQVLMSQFSMSIASDQNSYDEHFSKLSEMLSRLENNKTDGDFFNGNHFSLLDTAIAPLMTRFNALNKRFGKNYLVEYPKLTQYSETLLALDSVKKSVISDFEGVYENYLRGKSSYLATV